MNKMFKFEAAERSNYFLFRVEIKIAQEITKSEKQNASNGN